MKLTLRKPPKRRAKALGAVGTIVGALPLGVSRSGSSKPAASRLTAPVVFATLVVVGLVAKRRRSSDPAPDSWSAPAQPHGQDAAAGSPPPDAPPMPQPQAGPTTLTEREKAEAVGGVDVPEPVEGAIETAPGAASETPASGMDKDLS